MKKKALKHLVILIKGAGEMATGVAVKTSFVLISGIF